MSKKKIIFSVIAFLGSFILAVIVCFPLNQVASKLLIDTINERRLDIRYDDLNIGFFGSTVKNLKTGKLTIEKIEVDYNPISLLFKRLSIYAQSSAFTLNGSLKGDEINTTVKGSVAGISKMAGITGNGTVNGSLTYNLKTNQGTINLDSGKINVAHPIMNVEADSLKASAKIDNENLVIDKFTATGKNAINVDGSVKLNKIRIDQSILDINGSTNMGGYNMNFSLNGVAKAPKFTIK